MILVDSSVWIDYFRGTQTVQVVELDRALSTETVLLGDLVLTEVLQGFRSHSAAAKALHHLSAACPLIISDHRVAAEAARNYRLLRDRGRTIRKTIDTLIATRSSSTASHCFTVIGISIPSLRIWGLERRCPPTPELAE
jgi:predicted nucleic acid-binding protein